MPLLPLRCCYYAAATIVDAAAAARCRLRCHATPPCQRCAALSRVATYYRYMPYAAADLTLRFHFRLRDSHRRMPPRRHYLPFDDATMRFSRRQHICASPPRMPISPPCHAICHICFHDSCRSYAYRFAAPRYFFAAPLLRHLRLFMMPPC